MERFLDAAYRTTRSAMEVSFEAYKLVDLILSVAFAAVKYGGGAILGVVSVIAVEAATVFLVYRSLFAIEAFARAQHLNPISWFVQQFPIVAAFGFFAVGQSLVVFIVTIVLASLLTFKFKFVLGSRETDEGHYSPIDEGASEPDDPLTF